MDLETAIGEIDVPLRYRDTSINLCACVASARDCKRFFYPRIFRDLRRLIGELEEVIHTGKVASVVKYTELVDGMNAKKTRFDQLNRRFTVRSLI